MSDLPDEVGSNRFELRLITEAEAADMRAGRRRTGWHEDYPREDDLDACGLVRDGNAWGPRHVVRRFDGVALGSLGFFGPPEPAEDGSPEVEIGYGLVGYARGHGVMTECLATVLAETDALGVRVRASTRPENAASLRVLAKCGFTGLRGTTEDGELVLVRPLRAR